MVKAALAGARPQGAADVAGRRFRLASPATALVRVVTPADAAPTTAPGLPRAILPSEVPAQTHLIDVMGGLPRVLTPMEPVPRSRGRL